VPRQDGPAVKLAQSDTVAAKVAESDEKSTKAVERSTKTVENWTKTVENSTKIVETSTNGVGSKAAVSGLPVDCDGDVIAVDVDATYSGGRTTVAKRILPDSAKDSPSFVKVRGLIL
jgi:hypothetical protein